MCRLIDWIGGLSIRVRSAVVPPDSLLEPLNYMFEFCDCVGIDSYQTAPNTVEVWTAFTGTHSDDPNNKAVIYTSHITHQRE